MKARWRIRVSYANVVNQPGTVRRAWGSSYAALAVTGKQVRDGSLNGRDVCNVTLTGGDVRAVSRARHPCSRGANDVAFWLLVP